MKAKKRAAAILAVICLAAAIPGSTVFAVDGERTDIVVTVNGEDYYFSEAFSTYEIPTGYSETELTFNGAERVFLVNDADVYLGYLEDEDGNGSFFLYDEEDATFVPYTVISISDTTSIVLLSDTEGLSISENYVEGELTVNDLIYPYWIAVGDEDYDIFYALNTTTGETGFYRYDPEDDTYQAYEMTDAEETAEEEEDETFLTTVGTYVYENTYFVLLVTIACAAVLVFLVLVCAVKLRRRNQELDYLYEEYDIPLYGEEEDGSGDGGDAPKEDDSEEDVPKGDASEGDDPKEGTSEDENRTADDSGAEKPADGSSMPEEEEDEMDELIRKIEEGLKKES